MATGRTVGSKYTRAYVDGHDLSGYVVSVGNLEYGFEPNEIITLSDSVKGAYPGQCNIAIGDINAVLDTTAVSGFHTVLKSASDAVRDVTIPIGIRAAPVNGDPAFCAQVSQNAYQAVVEDGITTVNLDLGSWDERGDTKAYPYAWGNMIHVNGAETAANTSTGELISGEGQTTAGGYMMWHCFPGSTGTVTLSIDDSTGGAFSSLVSTAQLTQVATTAQSGIVALATTATVDTDLRWQIALGTASTTTFALAFVRGR